MSTIAPGRGGTHKRGGRKVFKMQMWQWVVVGVVAVACVGYMTFTIARMFGRRADGAAVLREATAFESARVGAEAPTGALAFDAFSYRVPARFAGRCRIVVQDGALSLAGPRVPFGLYAFWIWFQGIILALTPAALVAAIVKLDWKWLVAAVAVFVVAQAVSAIGAGIWPGFGEMEYIEGGRFKAVEFKIEQVHDVKIGAGWADGGINVVVMPVVKGIDQLAEGKAVSFFAPDDEGRDVRHAFHFASATDANEFAGLLGGAQE